MIIPTLVSVRKKLIVFVDGPSSEAGMLPFHHADIHDRSRIDVDRWIATAGHRVRNEFRLRRSDSGL